MSTRTQRTAWRKRHCNCFIGGALPAFRPPLTLGSAPRAGCRRRRGGRAHGRRGSAPGSTGAQQRAPVDCERWLVAGALMCGTCRAGALWGRQHLRLYAAGMHVSCPSKHAYTLTWRAPKKCQPLDGPRQFNDLPKVQYPPPTQRHSDRCVCLHGQTGVRTFARARSLPLDPSLSGSVGLAGGDGRAGGRGEAGEEKEGRLSCEGCAPLLCVTLASHLVGSVVERTSLMFAVVSPSLRRSVLSIWSTLGGWG